MGKLEKEVRLVREDLLEVLCVACLDYDYVNASQNQLNHLIVFFVQL